MGLKRIKIKVNKSKLSELERRIKALEDEVRR